MVPHRSAPPVRLRWRALQPTSLSARLTLALQLPPGLQATRTRLTTLMPTACMSASCPTVPAASPSGGAALPARRCSGPAAARRTMLRSHACRPMACAGPRPAGCAEHVHTTAAPSPSGLAPTRYDQNYRARTSSLSRVYDSGSQLENICAAQLPTLFNSEGTTDSFDKRSDNKGPEPEGVVSAARARCRRARLCRPRRCRRRRRHRWRC